VATASAALLAPAGWHGSDALERQNDFCNACHLGAGTPLHQGIRDDFDAAPARTLAAAHALAGVQARHEDPAFRCIDCHGGVGFLGKARVKLLAAKDALVWLTGRFEEPDHMAWPLLDADCRQCHDDFADSSEPGPGGVVPFHALPVHNAVLEVDCVECHNSHDAGGEVDYDFLHPQHVRHQCARCHTRFEEGT
jgi:hypothetical protein